MTRPDPVREYLTSRGARPDVVEGGVEGLLHAWERIVAEVGRGYALTLDDYRNDLDVRDLLEGALRAADAMERERLTPRVVAADSAFRAATDAGKSVWSDESSEDEARWWYFRRPRNWRDEGRR